MILLFLVVACVLIGIMLLMDNSKQKQDEIIMPDGKIHKELPLFFYILVMIIALIIIFLSFRFAGTIGGAVSSAIIVAVPILVRIFSVLSFLKLLNIFKFLKRILGWKK